MTVAKTFQTGIEPRDRLFGFISLSCGEGQCERCTPRVRAVANGDNVAPACVHKCHDTVALQRERDAELTDRASAQAENEDRQRVLGA